MKKRTIKSLKKEADRVFSLWIRKRDKKCVCCGSKKNLQCGHYISRSFNQLRYSEINCNCQCVLCNIWKSGNMSEYTSYLEKKYGYGIIQKLNKEKRVTKQWKVKELEEIIKKYASQD